MQKIGLRILQGYKIYSLIGFSLLLSGLVFLYNMPKSLPSTFLTIGTHTFTVEVARNPAEQKRGLMYRNFLPQDAGMFFVYKTPREVAFWMKNTPLFLDIIFIAQNRKIVRIIPMARPYDETPLLSGMPIIAVLEIGGGEAQRRGIVVGDSVNNF